MFLPFIFDARGRVRMCMLSRFSCFQLSAPACHGLQPARFLYLWGFSRQGYRTIAKNTGGLPCSPPGDLPHPGIKSASLLPPAGGLFNTRATWEAQEEELLTPIQDISTRGWHLAHVLVNLALGRLKKKKKQNPSLGVLRSQMLQSSLACFLFNTLHPSHQKVIAWMS